MGTKAEKLSLVIILAFILFSASCSLRETHTPTPIVPTFSPTPSPTPPSPTSTLDPRPTATPMPDIEGAIHIWMDWAAPEIQALKPHLNAFREMFPLVQIEISYYPPGEILERYRLAMSEGNAPDILFGQSQWGERLFQDGLIRELNERVPAEMAEVIYPVAWERIQEGRSIFALPFSLQGIVLYRNPAIVQEPVATLELMADMMEEIEERGKIGTVVELGFLYTGAYVSTCGGELLDEEQQLALTDRAVECWLRLLKTFSETGTGTQNTDTDLNRFLEGDSAWLVEGSWVADDLISLFGEEGIAIDPWPQYSPMDGNLAGYAWTRNIYFSVLNTDQQFDAAWVFARYMLTEEVQTSLAQAQRGRQLPVLRGLTFESAWLAEMMEALQENIPLPRDLTLSFFAEELEPAAFDVVRRKYDPYWTAQWAMSNIEKALLFRGGSLE